jgi:predicted dehydrogenase
MGGLRVGVVGCGYWGSKHTRVLHALTEVNQVVAIDQREERLLELERTYPGLVVCTDLDSALEQVDAVVIATPPRTHGQIALRAIAAGKSVLVEKPLATSVREATLMMAAAAANDVTLAVGHTFEHNAAVWKLRELIQSRELGDIYHLDSARLNLGLYQSDVNVLWDLAPHDISIFNYLLGSKPTAVEAWASRHANESVEDVAYLRLYYGEAGVTANVHVSWLDPCKVRRMTVVGSKKMAVYDDLMLDERIRVYDKGVIRTPQVGSLANPPMSYRYGEIWAPYIDFHEPLEYQDQHFVNCVLTGEAPLTDGADGLAVVEVLERAEASLHDHRSRLMSTPSFSEHGALDLVDAR